MGHPTAWAIQTPQVLFSLLLPIASPSSPTTQVVWTPPVSTSGTTPPQGQEQETEARGKRESPETLAAEQGTIAGAAAMLTSCRPQINSPILDYKIIEEKVERGESYIFALYNAKYITVTILITINCGGSSLTYILH